MFTGIVQETGKLIRVLNSSEKYLLSISCQTVQAGLLKGASIACNGICLTVTDFSNDTILVEVMAETLSRTTIGGWRSGDLINLERALSMSSFLDGHLVQGHVDTVVKVLQKTVREKTLYLNMELPDSHAHLVVEKGSITINGVSLTLFSLQQGSFTVALVDFTKSHTNLTGLKPGMKVNLEFDIVGKYLYRFAEHKIKQGIRENLLKSL